MDYVPLWNKSNASFLEGASHPEELVTEAHGLGLSALALTDRDGVYGVVRAHVKALELNQKLLIGAEMSVAKGAVGNEQGAFSASRVLPPMTSIAVGPLVVLAKNRAGYGALTQWISAARQRCEKGSAISCLEDVKRFWHEGLVYLVKEPWMLVGLEKQLGPERLKENVWAMVSRDGTPESFERESAVRHVAARLHVPTVAVNEVLYHRSSRQPLQDVLTALRFGRSLDNAGRYLRPHSGFALKTVEQMRQLFANDPASLNATVRVAESCQFSLGQIRYVYPDERLPEGVRPKDWLRRLTHEGASRRYPEGVPDDVTRQLSYELDLIERLDYAGYFLTMYEVVAFCNREKILCQGRGSAANSAVCFCLGITAVDPVKMELLFERFLSEERKEPPDIDLDIEHNRREEVIRWVYGRYGRRHAAMVANVIRYRLRSAVRDVGKVLGLGAGQLGRLSELMPYHGELRDDLITACGLDLGSTRVKLFRQLVEEIQDFPRHLSIHPGGFLLGHEAVDTLVPIEPGTMEGRTVIQWDKYDVEAMGLFKVDLLGLGALTLVRRFFELLKQHQAIDMNMATLPQNDSATYDMVSKGDTVGVFQIESRAQMAMLPRLKPRTFYDLVIEVALVRPGPIQGDMVHPYLRRREGLEPVEYPHPAFEKVLSRTLGVPIFQEQVMKLAILAAGYSPGEADKLRRDMGAWKSSGRIEEHHQRIISGMVKSGIDEVFAERVFSQIRGFGEYGFPESHAASFALIAYATSWMRCHYPALFVAALLDAQPMGFYAMSTIIDDAKRHGVVVRPIDVSFSEWDCSIESDGALRIGLRFVKGFGEIEKECLARAPAPCEDLRDLVARSRLSLRALSSLAEAGALDSLGGAKALNRRDALWNIPQLRFEVQDALEVRAESQQNFLDLSKDEEVVWDYVASSHSTRGHPMAAKRERLRQLEVRTAIVINDMPDKTRAAYVGHVMVRQRPQTASGVVFMTLEDETGSVNLVVWSQVFDQYELFLRTTRLLGVKGEVQKEKGVTHFIAKEFFDAELLLKHGRFPAPRAVGVQRGRDVNSSQTSASPKTDRVEYSPKSRDFR